MSNITRYPGDSSLPSKEIPPNMHDSYIPHRPFDFHRIFTSLIKRKLLIALITLSVLAASALYNFLTKPVYRSFAGLQIEPEAIRVLPYNTISDSLVNVPGDFELYMKTQDELIRGPELVSRAAQKVREQYPNADELSIDGNFYNGMEVVRIQGSQMLNIYYSSYDPDFSAYAADTIADEFIKYHYEKKVTTTEKATQFLKDQLAAQKQKVEEAETDLNRYAREHNIFTSGNNQVDVIRQRFSLLNTQVTEAERQCIQLRVAYEKIKDLTLEEFPSHLRSPEIANQETQLLTLEQELSTLLVQYGENWPAVIRKRQEVSVSRQQFTKLKQDALSRAKSDAETSYQAALTEYNDLSQKYREQQELVNRLNEANVKYNTLLRDAQASDDLYTGLVQRLGETGVGASLEFGNISKTNVAKPGRTPYKPRVLVNMAMGLFLGLSAGIWLALFLEYMDRSLKNPTDVEFLGIPLLGWIPITMAPSKKQMKISTGEKSGAILKIDVVPPSSQALAPRTSHNLDLIARESYRTIVASILLSRAGRPAQSILFTSAVPKEGKTKMVENIGKTLAEIGMKTLLIDADFRSPSLTNHFGLTNGKGFSIYLAGGDLNIRDTVIPNLYLLPSGPMPPNPVALLISDIFSKTIDMLKREFQYILIDGPPILSVTDPCVIAPKVDGVILVVKSGDVPTDLISRANQLLKQSGALVLGAAVNQVDLKSPENHTYRKYYYSQHYHGDPKDRGASGKKI